MIDEVTLKTIATTPASRYERPNRAVISGSKPERLFEKRSLTAWPSANNDESESFKAVVSRLENSQHYPTAAKGTSLSQKAIASIANWNHGKCSG